MWLSKAVLPTHVENLRITLLKTSGSFIAMSEVAKHPVLKYYAKYFTNISLSVPTHKDSSYGRAQDLAHLTAEIL